MEGFPLAPGARPAVPMWFAGVSQALGPHPASSQASPLEKVALVTLWDRRMLRGEVAGLHSHHLTPGVCWVLGCGWRNRPGAHPAPPRGVARSIKWAAS